MMEAVGSTSANKIPYTLIGEIPPLSSFLSANNDKECFGSFIIPKSFLDEFSEEISSKVKVKCKNFSWTAKVNVGKGKIYGLRRFMFFHGIKLLHMVQFNYHGNNFFNVMIFNDSAIECKYPTISPDELFKSDKMPTWKEKEYVLNEQSIEMEKSCALWSFNAFRNCVHYYQIEIDNVDLDKSFNKLRLKADIEPLYKNWDACDKVKLVLTERDWEISIQWLGGNCYFGKGWYHFAKDVEIDVGDTLVLFRLKSSGPTTINACIFKREHKIVYQDTEKPPWSKSFFKILSEESIVDGALVVPKRFKEIFSDNLSNMVLLKVAHHTWFISYNNTGGYLSKLGSMMECFKLQPRETIVFTIDNSSLLYGRIYQEDGKEVNYEKRISKISSGTVGTWFWNVEWQSHVEDEKDYGGDDYEMQIPDDAASPKVFDTTSMFPDFIIVSKAEQLQSGKLEIPEYISLNFGNNITSNVTFKFSSGSRVYGCYNVTEKCFSQMFDFLNEIRKFNGSIFLFKYECDGKFLVNVLNDDAVEVHYKRSRYQLRPQVCKQDYLAKFGFSFLITVGSRIYEFGELDIPEKFCNAVGGTIPPSIELRLKNREVFTCKFLASEKKISCLLKMIVIKHVEKKDLMLFTYYGTGNFDVVLFSKSKVEKQNQSSDMNEGNINTNIKL